MTDFKSILSATGIFVLGVFAMIILSTLMIGSNGLIAQGQGICTNTLTGMTVMNINGDTVAVDPSICTNTEVEGTMWLMFIIVGILFFNIMPIGVGVYGLREQPDEENFLNYPIAIFYVIICLLLIYLTNNWATTFAGMITEGIIKAMFWLGYIEIIIFNLIAVPYHLISTAKKED